MKHLLEVPTTHCTLHATVEILGCRTKIIGDELHVPEGVEDVLDAELQLPPHVDLSSPSVQPGRVLLAAPRLGEPVPGQHNVEPVLPGGGRVCQQEAVGSLAKNKLVANPLALLPKNPNLFQKLDRPQIRELVRHPDV